MSSPQLVGKTFGRLTVLAQLQNERGRSSWYCSCSCGWFKITNGNALQIGTTTSCGCARTIHGESDSPLHKVWTAMRERCNNPRNRSFKNYGGRGIKVCQRWGDFRLFISDMGPRPPGTTIDRIDNDGNYEPANCQWATYLEQNQHTRRTRKISAGGRTMTVANWARELGGSRIIIHNRLRDGWTEEKACLTPIRQRAKSN